MTITIPQPFGGLVIPRARAQPFNIEFVSNTNGFSSFSSPVTLNNRNVGGPGLIIFHLANANQGNVSGVTMDGSPMTLAAGNTGVNTRSGIYYARKASGTTATFVITGSSIARYGAQILRITGSLSSDTPFDTAADGGGSGSRSVSIDAPSGGGVVVAAIDIEQSSHNYTNATRLDVMIGEHDSASVGRYITVGATQSNRSITVNSSRCICAASWV